MSSVSHVASGSLPFVPVGKPRLMLNPLTGQIQSSQPYAIYLYVTLGQCGARGICALTADSNTGGGNGAGTLITTYASGNSYQLWYVLPVAGTSWSVLMNAAIYRVLDADPRTIGSNGGKVQLWDYVPGSPNEEWSAANPPVWDQPIQPAELVLLDNAATPKVLHPGATASGPVPSGTVVNMWDYVSGVAGNNEVWLVDPPM
jgi:hypothetical protein